MRMVFMGTPDFAVPALLALAQEGHDIAAVLSRPDRPSGRGKQVRPTPIKQAALDLGLPVYEPEQVNSAENLALLRELQADIFVVVAYGQFLGGELLSLPRYGAVNIHASLLPAYRGAAPIHRAVLNGESKSGVTIMYIDSGMDSGDIIISGETEIGPDMNSGQLHDALAEQGAELLIEALRGIEQGTAPRIAQDHSRASKAPMLKREEEVVDWSLSAREVHNRIRGLAPWPGAYTLLRGKRLKLRASQLADSIDLAAAPGQILSINEQGILAACGSGALWLPEVQPEGKGPMSGAALARGYHLSCGEILGE